MSDGVEQHQPKIMSGSMPNTPESSRRVRSGPKERTKEVVDERGIGDGRADQPKAESSRFVSKSSLSKRTPIGAMAHKVHVKFEQRVLSSN